MMILLLLTALAAETTFPERTPAMIESCLNEAVTSKAISKTGGELKYICGGEAAQELWNYLENAKVESWEQTTESGIWLSREFPMGGCFKRTRNVDGSAASSGLSCTIWIPHSIEKKR